MSIGLLQGNRTGCLEPHAMTRSHDMSPLDAISPYIIYGQYFYTAFNVYSFPSSTSL
jgi:hypothetical protein